VSTPPDDPGYRSDLPKLESERRPVGYQPGLQLVERLQGLGAFALGIVGLLVVYGIYSGFLPSSLLTAPSPPPGVLTQMPMLSASACLMPLMTLGSVGLIVVGVRRVVDP
jgi:hypothetical protein